MHTYQMRICYENVFKCIMRRAMNPNEMVAIQVVRKALAVALVHFVQRQIVQKRQTIHHHRVRFHIQHQIYPLVHQYIRLHIYCLIYIHMVSIRHIIYRCYTIRLQRLQWIIKIWTLICSMLNWHWPHSIQHFLVIIQVIRKYHHCMHSKAITIIIQSHRAVVVYCQQIQIIVLHRTIFRHRVLDRHLMRLHHQKLVHAV